MNTAKELLANTLSSFDNNYPKGMSECYSYGMTWGCDEDCPVYKRGECEIYEGEEKDD